MLVWMEYNNDPCGEGKTGRWCDNTAVDRKFRRDEVPSSIAVIRETSANSAVARRIFTNTKELAATEALYMGIKSPQGALTQWYDTRMLRDIQMHSDIMVARRQHKFYTLKLFPFNGNAKTAAHLKIELADAFLERDQGSQENQESQKDQRRRKKQRNGEPRKKNKAKRNQGNQPETKGGAKTKEKRREYFWRGY